MVRPIEFRGKRLDNNEWVMGDLVTVKNHPLGLKAHIAADGDTKLFYPGCRFLEVDPATVGQFIGLHDSTRWSELTKDECRAWIMRGNYPSDWEGRKIFEGDITGCGCVIGWYDKMSLFTLLHPKRLTPMCYPIDGRGIKIIGNIHDNPELLEGA